MYRKFKKVVLGLLAHVTPSIFFSSIPRSEALVSIDIVFRTAVLPKLFDIRFSYKHCKFSRVCLLVRDGFENRDKVYYQHKLGIRGGEATSHTFSLMKSKRCSHNLQSDQQDSCQRICVLIMRITSKTINQRS